MPVMGVSPTASAPRISARIEMDLSPGTWARPVRGPPRRAVSGVGSGCIAGAGGMTQPLRRASNSAVYHGLWRGVIRLFLAAKRAGSTIDSRVATSQVKHPNCAKDRTVAKPELGTKRLCASCSAKFYDLNKDPIHCPKCDAVYEVAVATRPVRPEPAPAPVARPPVPEEAPAVAEPQEVETVSLEEADAESQGATAKKPAGTEPEAEEEEVEMDETLDDDTFIEEQEEEDADVTDIIGGDRENEEER